MHKVTWSGIIVSIQPRIRLTRSFDERGHDYMGYSLFLEGTVGEEDRPFSVGIGQVAQSKHQLQVGDHLSGAAVPVADPHRQPVEFYRASGLKVIQRMPPTTHTPPPWHGVPPDLETYRWRGHRRLSARTYTVKCHACIWGCRMPVDLIVDPWYPRQMAYRFETYCYGPKSCPNHAAGPRRTVPGRKGMRWEEPDWLDEQMTDHRGWDE